MSDIEKYIGKQIIGWLYYNSKFNEYNENDTNTRLNTIVYVYPRLLKTNHGFEPINSNDFPKSGRIEVKLANGITAEEAYDRYGSLVQITINKAFGTHLDPKTDKNNHYSMRFNANIAKDSSEIWMERFSATNYLTQVIQTNIPISEIKKNRYIPNTFTDIVTQNVLIETDGAYYGPFTCDTKSNKIELSARKDNDYYIGKLAHSELTKYRYNVTDNNDEVKFGFVITENLALCDLENLENTGIDFIDDKELADRLSSAIRTASIASKEEINKLEDILSDIKEREIGITTGLSLPRLKQIEENLGQIMQNNNLVRDIIGYIRADENLQEYLPQDSLNKEHSYELNNELTSLEQNISEKQTALINLENDIKSFEVTIKALEEQKAKLNIDEIKKELTQEIADLENIKLDLKNEVAGIETYQELKIEMSNLEEKIKHAKEENRKQIIENDTLRKEITQIINDMSDQAKLTAKGFETKFLQQVLRVASGEDEEDETNITPIDNSLIANIKNSDLASKNDIVDILQEYLTNNGRILHRNDVINYLVCLSQGFITTFAGEPGTGKTSLCNLLAAGLGLVANNRFCDVAVERGWTSTKDFIGYYNPLTKNTEKSNIEAFEAFTRLHHEADMEKTTLPPYIVLLDEANLSPLEHYWSQFLKICDHDINSLGKTSTINLGGKKQWKIPEHLRFLATVNFDHTTEELSPRFLDRSWIISLEPQILKDNISSINKEPPRTMIAFNDLQKAFGCYSGEILKENIAKKWSAIQTIFQKNNLPIMPRNQKMIYNYLSVAGKYMESDIKNQYTALDFALSQKILPLINGSGERYKQLVNDLKNECFAMPICIKHLDRISRNAESSMGYYQFFAR